MKRSLFTYRAVVEYDGTDLHGFQYQTASLRTVAGELEAGLVPLFGHAVKITGAGRTDAGVHAIGQVVSFQSERAFPEERLALAWNAKLPPDVSVRDAVRASEGFSARHDALERRYIYVVLNRREPSALLRRYAHHEHRALDVEAARRAARDAIGTHDFRTFCGVPPVAGGTVRTLHALEIEERPPFVLLRFRGNGFLHRMVRTMTGTLLEVAAGRRSPDSMPATLAARDRRAAGFTVPPQGLFLSGVRYPGFDANPGDGRLPPIRLDPVSSHPRI